MKKFILLLCGCIVLISGLHAQSAKARAALNELNASDLVLRFDSLANIVESGGRSAKRNAAFGINEQEALHAAYNTAVERFNLVLQVMKNDLLSSEQRRLMRKDPKAYSARIGSRLESACSTYDSGFIQQKRAFEQALLPKPAPQDSTAAVADAIFPVIPVALIVEVVMAGYEVFKRISDDQQVLTEKLLQTEFYTPHLVKMWDEL